MSWQPRGSRQLPASLEVRRRRHTLAEAACWVLLGVSVLSGPAVNGISYLQFPVVGLLILSSALAAAVGLTALWRVYHRARRATRIAAIIALVTACLFLLRYLLWSQGAIPHYNTAALFVALLVAASVYAGRRYVRHRLATEDPPTPSDGEEHKASAGSDRAENAGQQ